MKRALATALFLALGTAACGPDAGNGRPPRGDWRHQAAVCTSDDQCGGGGPCVIADGAARGTCAAAPGGSGEPSLPPGHPRRPNDPNAPGDDAPPPKPQPGDIQL